MNKIAENELKLSENAEMHIPGCLVFCLSKELLFKSTVLKNDFTIALTGRVVNFQIDCFIAFKGVSTGFPRFSLVQILRRMVRIVGCKP